MQTSVHLQLHYDTFVLLSLSPPLCMVASSPLLLQVGQCFTVLARPEGGLAAGKIANVLKFRVKEIDPTTGEAEEDGYDDEYQVGRKLCVICMGGFSLLCLGGERGPVCIRQCGAALAVRNSPL